MLGCSGGGGEALTGAGVGAGAAGVLPIVFFTESKIESAERHEFCFEYMKRAARIPKTRRTMRSFLTVKNDDLAGPSSPLLSDFSRVCTVSLVSNPSWVFTIVCRVVSVT